MISRSCPQVEISYMEVHLVSWVSVLLFGMAGFLPQSAQTPKTASFLPSVSISLPPDILSETVQISYFVVGPFGGYGGHAAPGTCGDSFPLPHTTGNKPATQIWRIGYVTGCAMHQIISP